MPLLRTRDLEYARFYHKILAINMTISNFNTVQSQCPLRPADSYVFCSQIRQKCAAFNYKNTELLYVPLFARWARVRMERDFQSEKPCQRHDLTD